MTFWKALLGVGLACAACCAAPLIGAGALIGSALLVRVDALLALLALAAAGGLLLWRRRRAASSTNCGCADTCKEQCPLP
ncbi:MAG: hypothetical protein EOP39_10095 [Rubrivivax sp.]|nr:MAG: hypothetical protein EOP39_10095 [Rubrivivax sp.]